MALLHPLEYSLEELVVELVVLLVLVIIVSLVLGHPHLPNVNLAAGVEPVILLFEDRIRHSCDKTVSIISKRKVVQSCIGIDSHVCAREWRN